MLGAHNSSTIFNFLKLPQEKLIYAERYLNGGSRTYSAISSYTEIQLKFQPQSDVISFSLPLAQLSNKIVQIHLANPDTQLLANYVRENSVLFPVHPQFYKNTQIPFMKNLMQHTIEESSAEITPTASTRSVIVLNNELPLHCLKLHCPAQISRFNRKLDARDISKSVNTSRELDRALKEEAKFPACFGYLPESIGVSVGEGKEAWGFLMREMTPRPVAKNAQNRTLFPMFSLYSLDTKDSENNEPLLVDLIRNSKLDPTDFILNKVMLPIIESWCFMARDLGFLTQAHGQNLLLEVDQNGMPTRVIFRDLSTYMDRSLREERGLSNEGFPLPGSTDDPDMVLPSDKKVQGGYYSLTYDSFVGHHLFDYLAKSMFEHYGIQKEVLQEACKKKFEECFPLANEHMPENVYYYSQNCTDGFTQELVDTGEIPNWR